MGVSWLSLGPDEVTTSFGISWWSTCVRRLIAPRPGFRLIGFDTIYLQRMIKGVRNGEKRSWLLTIFIHGLPGHRTGDGHAIWALNLWLENAFIWVERGSSNICFNNREHMLASSIQKHCPGRTAWGFCASSPEAYLTYRQNKACIK